MGQAPGTIRYRFTGEVWFTHNPQRASIWFVSLPREMSAAIFDLVGNDLNPWGTVPVEVSVGDFTWKSAMFPRENGAWYDLPLNARVRKRLKLDVGNMLDVTIDIPLPV